MRDKYFNCTKCIGYADKNNRLVNVDICKRICFNIVPSYLPKEQVIKFIRIKIKEREDA